MKVEFLLIVCAKKTSYLYKIFCFIQPTRSHIVHEIWYAKDLLCVRWDAKPYSHQWPRNEFRSGAKVGGGPVRRKVTEKIFCRVPSLFWL